MRRIEEVAPELSRDVLVFNMPIGVHSIKPESGQSVICTAFSVSPQEIHKEDTGEYYGVCPACHQKVKFQYKPRQPTLSRWRTDFSR